MTPLGRLDPLARLRRLSASLFAFIESRHQATQQSVATVLHQVLATAADNDARHARAADALARVLGQGEHQQLETGDIQDQLMLLRLAQRDLAGVVADLATRMPDARLTTPSLPAWFWQPAVADRVRAILRLLRPRAITGHAKTRLGRAHDGGYVMLDDFEGVGHAISCGVNDDTSWDTALAERAITLDLYDHTIAAPPIEHSRFHFHRLRIGARDADGARSLATALAMPETNADLILKLDIEGDEWPSLEATEGAALERCRQIVCEFHDLHRLAEDAFADRAASVFRKLAERFHVAHVHGNNCGSLVNVGNVSFPQSLEVTFAARRHYRDADTDELFPTPLDMPNQPGRADLFLGAFRF